MRGYHETEVYKKAYRKRSVWVEPLFARSAKTGMACDAFGYGSSGAPTVRRSREQRGKISSGCSNNEAGDGGHSRQGPFLSSFWLLVRGDSSFLGYRPFSSPMSLNYLMSM